MSNHAQNLQKAFYATEGASESDNNDHDRGPDSAVAAEKARQEKLRQPAPGR